MNSLIWIAVVLFVVWLVVKFVFAVTSLIFHVLWIIALVLLIVWLAKKFL